MEVAADRTPLVTVNILTHNRRDLLARSLRIMHEELEYPRERLEFIVVDNASRDGTAEMLQQQFPDVRLIENANNGSAGWTRGFEAGRGEYFLVLDDDCYLSGDSLRDAVGAAEAEGAQLVSFRVRSSFDPGYEFGAEYRVGLLSFWGCAVLIARAAVDELGGFDPEIFIWGNELEFTIRLLDRGFRHLFLSEVSAVHAKPPLGTATAGIYSTHTRHLAYIATKLLRPADALLTLVNLTTKAILDMARFPARWRALPALLNGFYAGLRSRDPVRPQISRLYRREFREFRSPWFYLGRPLALWRSSRDRDGVAGYIRSRHEDFYAAREELYPRQTASLKL
jgi:GT2 family glycosyltransferase